MTLIVFTPQPKKIRVLVPPILTEEECMAVRTKVKSYMHRFAEGRTQEEYQEYLQAVEYLTPASIYARQIEYKRMYQS